MADTFTFTYDDLKEILAGRVGMEQDEVPTDPAMTFEEAGLDSLAIMEIQAELEQRYGFEVSSEEAEGIKNFNDVVNYVHAKMGA